MKIFQLDIITPSSIQSFDNITYLRIPSLDGLTGVQARHAAAIIALDVGEIKITINGKDQYFATSGGFSDIQPEGIQLLLETFEGKNNIDKNRAEKSLMRAQKRITDKSADIDRVQLAMQRAKNRLNIFSKN